MTGVHGAVAVFRAPIAPTMSAQGLWPIFLDLLFLSVEQESGITCARTRARNCDDRDDCQCDDNLIETEECPPEDIEPCQFYFFALKVYRS